MARNVSIRQALVVPTRGVLRMERVPSLPAVRELTIRDEDDEVHIAELVGLTTRERSEKNESLERRLGRSFGELEDTRPLTPSFRGSPARPVVESDHERRFSQRARATDSGQPDLGACDEPLPDVVARLTLSNSPAWVERITSTVSPAHRAMVTASMPSAIQREMAEWRR